MRTLVLWANSLTGSRSLELALLAAEVLFACSLFLAEGHLTVDHATEVNLLALKALVEGALVQSKGLEVALVVASGQVSLRLVKSLVFGHFQGLDLHFVFHLLQFDDFIADFEAIDLL